MPSSSSTDTTRPATFSISLRNDQERIRQSSGAHQVGIRRTITRSLAAHEEVIRTVVT